MRHQQSIETASTELPEDTELPEEDIELPEDTELPEADIELPEDADLEVAETPAGGLRPIHLRPGYLLIVAAGGALGTAAREGATLAFQPAHGLPFITLVINVLGAFLLGLLLDFLARSGPDQGGRRTLRLLLGTGFMGGFTTYSALAAQTADMIGHGATGWGIGYALATLLIGAGATWAGVALASSLRRQREGRRI